MKRVLLKLSGEVLPDRRKQDLTRQRLLLVAEADPAISDEGVQIGIVIGGGNFWRGRTSGDDRQ